MFTFSTKPKVLFFADSAISARLAEQYQAYSPELSVVITTGDWLAELSADHYDVFCHSNLPLMQWRVDLDQFLDDQHKNNTKIVLHDPPLLSIDYSKFDGVIISDSARQGDFVGAVTFLVPYGVNLDVFGPDIRFEKRKFRVICRKSDEIWQSIRKQTVAEFVELFDRDIDPVLLNDVYNNCQFIYGETGAMEAAACGVIPLIKKQIPGFDFLVFEDETDLIQKIKNSKNNKNTRLLSHKVSKSLLSLDSRRLAPLWGEAIQKIIMKKKALYFT